MNSKLHASSASLLGRVAAGLLWAAALLLESVAAQSPAIITDHDSYVVGESIVVNFSSGPGNRLDWVGIYPVDVTPGQQASTRWSYVDGTQGGATGLREGSVTFADGLSFAGDWKVVFLKNDGYEVMAEYSFNVVDPGAPLVRANKRQYAIGEAISISFLSGPGNPKDWIGIYKVGEVPGGGPTSTVWSYVDGGGGTTGKTEGTVSFSSGLASPNTYVAYLLQDDGYTILASEKFTVAAPSGQGPRLLSVSPADGATGISPLYTFLAKITNGTTDVVLSSVVLKVDGQSVPAQASVADRLVTVTYTATTLLAPQSLHSYVLSYSDTSSPAKTVEVTGSFIVAAYENIVLPAPLYLETFDAVPEGQVPEGWTLKSYTEVLNEELDLGNLDSKSYANWVVVDVSRFNGSFVTYSNPDNPDTWENDYRRVLTPNPLNVVNGKVLDGPLASGRMLFGDSGYRNGAGQYLIVYTKDFDLTGKSDIYLSFHSLYEQNQDSLGALEYSIDGGTTWLPVVYLMDARDIVYREADQTVDAVETFNAARGDAALLPDGNGGEVGGTYGAFIGAAVTDALAPYIQGRADDNAVESKRVEKIRLPQADNQKTVRFRIAYSGTDSWYWGIDDFGLYSIAATTPAPALTYTATASGITVSWPADAVGYQLESSTSLTAPDWAPVSGVTGNSVTVPFAKAGEYLRLRKP